MLFDDDPVILLKQCRTNFQLHPDRAALTRISSSLSNIQQARTLRLNSSESSLKKLNRQFSTLTQQHELNLSAHNPAEHAAHIMALDTQKFRVAKEASDLEVEEERLESEARRADGVLREFERHGVEGAGLAAGALGRVGDAGTSAQQDVLKLKLYRSLGIEVEQDAQGEFGRAIVRSANGGRAQVVHVEPGIPKTFYANHFWHAL